MSVKFYCCYLLQSTPKPTSFYIGSTPDPFRRLRQHNGELTQGAYKTKSAAKRPWRMICCISGFQSQVAALQFEHAWQHAYKTRHIPKESRIVTSRSQTYRSLDKYIGNLRLLARAEAFSKLPLKVHLLETTAYDAWMKNKFKIDIPDYIRVENDVREEPQPGSEGAVSLGGGRLPSSMEEHSQDKIHELYKDYDKSTAAGPLAVCPECFAEMSLTELATKLLETSPDQVLPRSGPCPSCGKQIDWHVVAKFANMR